MEFNVVVQSRDDTTSQVFPVTVFMTVQISVGAGEEGQKPHSLLFSTDTSVEPEELAQIMKSNFEDESPGVSHLLQECFGQGLLTGHPISPALAAHLQKLSER